MSSALKLVMNPKGHVQDWNQLKQTGIYSEPSALSPEICHDIVKDLHSPSGKGIERHNTEYDYQTA